MTWDLLQAWCISANKRPLSSGAYILMGQADHELINAIEKKEKEVGWGRGCVGGGCRINGS